MNDIMVMYAIFGCTFFNDGMMMSIAPAFLIKQDLFLLKHQFCLMMDVLCMDLRLNVINLI